LQLQSEYRNFLLLAASTRLTGH